MTAMLIEPAQPIPIIAEPDVLVVGGGPAGAPIPCSGFSL